MGVLYNVISYIDITKLLRNIYVRESFRYLKKIKEILYVIINDALSDL